MNKNYNVNANLNSLSEGFHPVSTALRKIYPTLRLQQTLRTIYESTTVIVVKYIYNNSLLQI